MTKDWWFSYECVCGIVLDLRAPDREEALPVTCPGCLRHEAMYFRGRWEADEAGYGSQGNTTEVVSLVRAATALERAKCERICLDLASDWGKAAVALLANPPAAMKWAHHEEAAKACAGRLGRRA